MAPVQAISLLIVENIFGLLVILAMLMQIESAAIPPHSYPSAPAGTASATGPRVLLRAPSLLPPAFPFVSCVLSNLSKTVVLKAAPSQMGSTLTTIYII